MGWHVELAPDGPDLHIVVQDDTVTLFEATARQVSFPLWSLPKVIAGLQKVEQWHCRCSPAAAAAAPPASAASSPEASCPVHTKRGEKVKIEKWG